MFRKKQAPTELQTVSFLKRSVAHSLVSKLRIKTFKFVGLLKKFYRDYRLPSVASTVFLVLLLLLGVVRQLEQTSLIALRNEVTDGGNGYSILLNADETDQFKRDNSTDEPGRPSSSNGSNSFTSSSTNDDDDDGDTGGSSGGGGSGGGGGGQTPSQPFSVAIASFSRGNTLLECTNPSKPNKGSCSKIYTFNSDIQTQNGPGTVNYSWQSSIAEGDGTGSFSAAAGSGTTTVSKEVRLLCSKNSNFTIQLAITSPSTSGSNTLSVTHNCNEL